MMRGARIVPCAPALAAAMPCVFHHGGSQAEVRSVIWRGGPAFVAKDMAEALGYVWQGTSGTMAHVPEEWRGVCSVQTPSGRQERAMLTEPGLYFFLGSLARRRELAASSAARRSGERGRAGLGLAGTGPSGRPGARWPAGRAGGRRGSSR